MDVLDEYRMAMTYYKAGVRMPEMPDRTTPVRDPRTWYERLTPEEARRLADAINRS